MPISAWHCPTIHYSLSFTVVTGPLLYGPLLRLLCAPKSDIAHRSYTVQPVLAYLRHCRTLPYFTATP